MITISKFKEFNESNKIKKVAVFHGLRGETHPDRIKQLESIGYSVYCPHIDYEKEWEIDKSKSMIENLILKCSDVDLIIGTSLGGYLAFVLSNLLNIKSILINPLLDRSKTKLEIKEFDFPFKLANPDIEVFFGENDTLIPKEFTMDFLKKSNIRYIKHIIKNMEHGCPSEKFEEILKISKLV